MLLGACPPRLCTRASPHPPRTPSLRSADWRVSLLRVTLVKPRSWHMVEFSASHIKISENYEAAERPIVQNMAWSVKITLDSILHHHTSASCLEPRGSEFLIIGGLRIHGDDRSLRPGQVSRTPSSSSGRSQAFPRRMGQGSSPPTLGSLPDHHSCHLRPYLFPTVWPHVVPSEAE